jgi:hypothetical protein
VEPLKRLYPTRQVYFRANGKVRFLSLSPLSQIAMTALALGATGWLGIVTFNYISLDGTLAKKEQELSDSRKAYNALNSDLSRLEDQLQGTMKAVEAKQHYLESLLGNTDGDVAEEPPRATEHSPPKAGEEPPKADDDAAAIENDGTADDRNAASDESGDDHAPGIGGPFTAAPDDNAPDAPAGVAATHTSWQMAEPWRLTLGAPVPDTLPEVSTSRLKAIEQQIVAMRDSQLKLARLVISYSTDRIAAITKGFATAGLSVDAVMGALDPADAPMGGPFEALPSDERTLLEEESDSTFQSLFDKVAELGVYDRALASFPVAKPLKGSYYVSSPFGVRVDPFRKSRAMHAGLDMAGHWKEEVYATASGTVDIAGWDGAYGRMVEIDHGNGFKTRYGHLQTVLVKKGQHINEGERIGMMGTSGRSTGTHLHYEVRFLDKPYNPLKFFEAEQHVLKQ